MPTKKTSTRGTTSPKRAVKKNVKKSVKKNVKRATRSRTKVDHFVAPAPGIPEPIETVFGTGSHNSDRTSTREYKCFSCGQLIPSGTKYARTEFQYDRGGFNVYKERACPPCSELAEAVGEITGTRPSPLGLKAFVTNRVDRGEITDTGIIAGLGSLNGRFIAHGRDKVTVFSVSTDTDY